MFPSAWNATHTRAVSATGNSSSMRSLDLLLNMISAYLPVITKKFRRGKNSKDKQGAGLGLAIASELMEKMGGSLECSNADGGFRVKLMFRLA